MSNPNFYSTLYVLDILHVRVKNFKAKNRKTISKSISTFIRSILIIKKGKIKGDGVIENNKKYT